MPAHREPGAGMPAHREPGAGMPAHREPGAGMPAHREPGAGSRPTGMPASRLTDERYSLRLYARSAIPGFATRPVPLPWKVQLPRLIFRRPDD